MYIYKHIIVVVQSLSHVQLFATPRSAACQASLSFTISRSLLNSCPLSQWCHPTISSPVTPFSSCPQSFSMSQLFPSDGQSIGASASAISLSNEYSGLISFRIDWFDFPAVQGTLKGILQYHSLKASVFWHLAFFVAQLSHPYMTTKLIQLCKV